MISEACEGQTRNQFVARLCLYSIRMMENFEQIEHMLMALRHCHMEVDSMHARIEKSPTFSVYIFHVNGQL